MHLACGLIFQVLTEWTGTVSKAEIESTYKITRRIEAEERSLEGAMMVFTSTQQEIDEQWGLYDAYVPSQLSLICAHEWQRRNIQCCLIIL